MNYNVYGNIMYVPNKLLSTNLVSTAGLHLAGPPAEVPSRSRGVGTGMT